MKVKKCESRSGELQRKGATKMFSFTSYNKIKVMSKFILKSLVIIFTLSLVACDKEQEEQYGTINYIGYGTSFGECLGYCVNYMKVFPDLSRLSRTGWDEFGTLPKIQCSQQLELYEYVAIRDSINPNNFFFMDETIGCPDCADGGAEWIEISFDTLFHRVTFEYMNEPEELAYVVPLLREMMTSFTGCEEQ